MPFPITESLPAYITQEIERETLPIPKRSTSLGPDVTPISPYVASLLGGLADTGSTYAFLKRGTMTEDNALAAGLSKSPGAMAAIGAAANVALPFVLKHTLGKASPKIAEALAANQGALQMGYGAINTQNTLTPRSGKSEPRNTADQYRAALMAHLRRNH